MRFYMLVMLAVIMLLCMVWGAGEMDAAQAQAVPETSTMWMEIVPELDDSIDFTPVSGDLLTNFS